MIKLKLSIIEKTALFLIVLFSIVMFCYYLNQNYSVNYYDEERYVHISNQILINGLFNLEESLRTYLYPLLIALFRIFTNGDIIVTKIIFSVFQYLCYCFLMFLMAKSFYRLFNTKIVWFSILIFGLLNPYLIQSTTLFLTDILALSFIMISMLLVLFGSFEKKRTYALIFLFLYSAVMIRPSSLIFIPIILVLLLFRKMYINDIRLKKCIYSAGILMIVFIPQLYNNVVQYNHWTPLIHNNLYSFQSKVAAMYLKYGTVIIPGEVPGLVHYSPFYLETENMTIFSMIFNEFFAFIVVYTSHIFGVLDWGYIDTYIRDFYSLDRIIASLLLYFFWIVSVYGIYIILIKKEKNKIEKFVIFALLFSVIIYTIFIGTTAIESRFGYPIYLLMLPFSYAGLEGLAKNKKLSNLVLKCFICVIVVMTMFYLSFMMDAQTGRIDWFSKLF